MAGDETPGNALELWRSFPQDPRTPGNATLRASDADRDRIHRVLASAYAEGRLDRLEFDERTDLVARARTLGELPALVTDLLPDPGPALTPATRWVNGSIAEQAQAAYLHQRRQALWGFISASVICWTIWLATGHDDIPWPLFVMLGTGLNVMRTVFMRGAMVAEETQRLQRKEEKRQIKDAQRRELPPGPDS